MIHKLEAERSQDGRECYLISSGGSWLPGAYDTERAARYAFRFNDEDLDELQKSINPNGLITFEMLQKLRRHLL